MTATHDVNPTIPTTLVLYLSLELSQKSWKLAFTVGLGQKPRLRTIVAERERGPPGPPPHRGRRAGEPGGGLEAIVVRKQQRSWMRNRKAKARA